MSDQDNLSGYDIALLGIVTALVDAIRSLDPSSDNKTQQLIIDRTRAARAGMERIEAVNLEGKTPDPLATARHRAGTQFLDLFLDYLDTPSHS